jgi:hypothetical protein
VYAQVPGSLSEIPLPGGVPAALAVLHDPLPADRGQFLTEVIRRLYSTPVAIRSDPRAETLRALLAHLEQQRRSNAPASTVPLPLTPAIWTGTVFGGRTTQDELAGAILESRNASLLYYALMSLDGDTREWIAADRGLLADLAGRWAPAFAVAAPGFKVSAGRVRLPGGDRFEAAWEAFIGHRVGNPADFLRAVLSEDEGRAAYLLTALAELTPEQVGFALGDPANAPAALRRLSAAIDKSSPGWKISDRTFSRPRRDPALLVSDLVLDDRGVPVLAGSRTFWTAVFSPDAHDAQRRRDGDTGLGQSEFAWLAEQVFFEPPHLQRARYDAVLFASRIVKDGARANVDDAIDAVRAAWKYPALAAVLERAHATDLSVYAAASRRAARLSSIGNDDRRTRAFAQFQGTIALLARMVAVSSITPAEFEAAVSAVCRLDLDRDAYNGALVKWLAGWIRSRDIDENPDAVFLQLLAGSRAGPPRTIEWEGTQYRVDLAAAESIRLERLLGERQRTFLADALGQRGAAADEAWGRGATQLAYAVALGQTDRVAVSIGELAGRHDFGFHVEPTHNFGPWTLPVADVSAHGYRVGGSLLGLDTALAEFSLTRVSTKAPPRKPSVSSEERAVYAETVALVEPSRLSDNDRDTIARALNAGRVRIGSVNSPEEAAALTRAIPMGPVRRTQFPWIVAHDRSRAASFFSVAELLWIGLGDERPAFSADGWGISAHPRTGCLCLQVTRTRSGDMLTGRVNAGILATGFPDLGLRVAELLAELRMPAALFRAVLASATLDFVNGAVSRDEDDRRGLVEYVLALRVDRVEEYLAMLTTGGPLVPPRDSDRLAGVAPARRQP